MADNTTLNAMSGGDTIADDDIGGVKYQRVKVNYGDDGVAIDASDAKPLPTKQYAANAALTNVATSTTSAQLLPANPDRRGAIVYNDAAATLYVKLGATASTTSYSYAVTPGGTLETPFGYSGRLDAILASGTGTARVTELT